MPHEGMLGPRPDPSDPALGLDLLPALRLPDFVDPNSAWIEHIPFAFWIVEKLRPRCVVELGTHGGTSYFALCQAIRDFGIDARAFAIDAWPGDAHAGSYDDSFHRRVAERNEHHYGAFSCLIRGTFDSAAADFKSDPIELLHIDGCPTYESARHDFETWRKLLAPNAIVLFHDTRVYDRGFGVWRLFEELRGEFPCFEFPHGGGLGVTWIGGPIPPRLACLFAAVDDGSAARSIHAIFARLGEHVAIRARLETLFDRAETLAERVDTLEGSLKDAAASASAREDVVRQLGAQCADLREQITRRERDETAAEAERAGLRRQIAILRGEIHRREVAADAVRARLAAVHDSTSWRLTAPLRRLVERPGTTMTGRLVGKARAWVNVRRGRGVIVAPSSSSSSETRVGGWAVPGAADPYACWLIANTWNRRAETLLRERLAIAGDALVTFSIVMPVFRPDLACLRRAIESVRRQVLEHWELCIADDASGSPEVAAELRAQSAADARIRVIFRDRNGHISRATNSAAELASGEFLVLLDQDDELAPDALAELALRIAAYPDTDLIYSDSDKINGEGRRYGPHLKPDFSPELLLGYMYAGQTLGIRASLFRDLGGLRPGYEGSQDHDLALRASERARRVEHVPKILYHWRSLPGSTAASGGEKPYSFEAGRRAVQDALQRRGSTGTAFRPDWAVKNNNALFHVAFPDDGPSVGIIIPTKNQLPLLRQCIDSLARTTYRNFRILVIDNESDDPATLRWLERLPDRKGFSAEVLRVSNAKHGRFNFSYLVNQGVAALATNYVLLLNNDVEVINPNWLSALVGYGQMPGIGCVGALLRYPDGTVQHAGITQTDLPPILVDHTFKHAAAHDFGTLSFIQLARDTIAVTAACLLVSRRLFLDIGGFDETAFGVAYNDVDFCFRVENAGYRNVYTPTAELTHHEGASRGFRDDPRELANFRERYGGRGDRYLNPNFSRRSVSFELRPTHVALGVPRKIRTIIVTHNLNLEGAPKAILETACCLARASDVEPIVFAYQDGPLRAQYEAAGITVVIVPAGPPDEPTLAGFERSLLDLGRMFQEFAAEVVLANTLDTFNAIDAARDIGIPSLWLIHESEGWHGYYRPEIERRALACFGHPYRVIFVADATRRIYADLDYHHNATVIPGGLDRAQLAPFLSPGAREKCRADLGLAETDRMILMLGTVCERKGQIDLVLALRHLDPPALGAPTKIFLVGDRENDYSRDLRAAVASLPAAWRALVHIVAETPDVGPYYAAADLFVFTSRMESYPRVLMEAMAFGLPIITTPVNGVVEQVRPGINAEFFSPGDVAGLAMLLSDFLGDPKRRAEYGANSLNVLRGLNTHEDTARMIGEAIVQAAGSGIFPTRVAEFSAV